MDLTDHALQQAPTFPDIAEEVAERVNGHCIVGHNVLVDWRLLCRHHPRLHPAGLIDTLPPTRASNLPGRHGLTTVLEQLGLAADVNRAVPTGQPHRALWDTTAAAMLLTPLTVRTWPAEQPTIDQPGRSRRTPTGIHNGHPHDGRNMTGSIQPK
jgi:DNA polymerase-3 subunit epsilon